MFQVTTYNKDFYEVTQLIKSCNFFRNVIILSNERQKVQDCWRHFNFSGSTIGVDTSDFVSTI